MDRRDRRGTGRMWSKEEKEEGRGEQSKDEREGRRSEREGGNELGSLKKERGVQGVRREERRLKKEGRAECSKVEEVREFITNEMGHLETAVECCG